MLGKDDVCRILCCFRVAGYVYHYRNHVHCGYSKRIIFINECIPLMPGGGEFISKRKIPQKVCWFWQNHCDDLHLLSNLCNFWVICGAVIGILSQGDLIPFGFAICWANQACQSLSCVLPTSLITIKVGPSPALISTNCDYATSSHWIVIKRA